MNTNDKIAKLILLTVENQLDLYNNRKTDYSVLFNYKNDHYVSLMVFNRFILNTYVFALDIDYKGVIKNAYKVNENSRIIKAIQKALKAQFNFDLNG